MRDLDETSAAAVAGEVRSPMVSALVWCNVIYACESVHDVKRAAQWCATVRELAERIQSRQTLGFCRSHYARVLVTTGHWREAEAELELAHDDFAAARRLACMSRRWLWQSYGVGKRGSMRRSACAEAASGIACAAESSQALGKLAAAADTPALLGRARFAAGVVATLTDPEAAWIALEDAVDVFAGASVPFEAVRARVAQAIREGLI